MVVKIGDGARDDLDELGSIVLMEELFGTDPVEKLSSLAEIGDEVH